MQVNSRFQIRGVPGLINRTDFDGRLVDFWSPPTPTHLIIAHDGQNIFDPRSATRRATWRMAQSAIKVFEAAHLVPPAIIAIFHSGSKGDPNGRYKDLTPQNPFQANVKPLVQSTMGLHELRGNEYQSLIAERIVPSIMDYLKLKIDFENIAMVGSSMGGLATLNALNLRKDFFRTALAFSPHWVIGGKPLVEEIVKELPAPGVHKIWMSRGDRKLDASYKHEQEHADKLMRELGWRHDYKSTVFHKAGHNERAWAKQISAALQFWLFD